MTEQEYWFTRYAEDQQYREAQHAAIMQKIAEEKHFGYWQLCPKCDGEKTVKVYYPDTTAVVSHAPCGVCGGAGVIPRPEIKSV